eukprot:GILJ01007464.1.p1 GENE.GILJ01007464.1~~GILJ01007464.1.p1  ORF type:complete len:593 (-),score=54.80 GILJ01007464.1:170-1948(-)
MLLAGCASLRRGASSLQACLYRRCYSAQTLRSVSSPLVGNFADYNSVVKNFKWSIPSDFNIGHAVCDVHAEAHPNRPAIIVNNDSGNETCVTFAQLREQSNRLANSLTGLGVAPLDTVGILLPQSTHTAVSHIATYKIGAIAVPLFTLFGPEALEYRLQTCSAKVLITDAESLEKILSIRDKLPHLRHIIVTNAPAATAAKTDTILSWDAVMNASPEFEVRKTKSDDPAVIIFTSGTTGPPKGALHAHRVLLGHLPGVELPHNMLPQDGDVFWTPADWAWIGGLFDVLLPGLYHGVPVLAHRYHKFDPEHAFHLMAKHRVRNVFFPPTALKLMRSVPNPASRHQYSLRSIGCGGESLGSELLHWGRETFGFTINEFYGQTECNLLVANSESLFSVRPGSMGRAVPGHQVQIVDDAGDILPAGTIGNIAAHRPDPVMFLGYWNNPAATKEKFAKDWLLTGDLGRMDSDGYLYYVGRNDDVIKSGGYRIGPGEVEDCILQHDAVSMCAVVGSPDPIRGDVVKAFILLKPSHTPSDALANAIQSFVKQRLAHYEYPREIEFVDAIPMTATGKIIRKELRQKEVAKKSQSTVVAST